MLKPIWFQVSQLVSQSVADGFRCVLFGHDVVWIRSSLDETPVCARCGEVVWESM